MGVVSMGGLGDCGVSWPLAMGTALARSPIALFEIGAKIRLKGQARQSMSGVVFLRESAPRNAWWDGGRGWRSYAFGQAHRWTLQGLQPKIATVRQVARPG